MPLHAAHHLRCLAPSARPPILGTLIPANRDSRRLRPRGQGAGWTETRPRCWRINAGLNDRTPFGVHIMEIPKEISAKDVESGLCPDKFAEKPCASGHRPDATSFVNGVLQRSLKELYQGIRPSARTLPFAQKSASICAHLRIKVSQPLTLTPRSLWNQSATQCKVKQGFFLQKNLQFFWGHFEGKTLGNQAKTAQKTPQKRADFDVFFPRQFVNQSQSYLSSNPNLWTVDTNDSGLPMAALGSGGRPQGPLPWWPRRKPVCQSQTN